MRVRNLPEEMARWIDAPSVSMTANSQATGDQAPGPSSASAKKSKKKQKEALKDNMHITSELTPGVNAALRQETLIAELRNAFAEEGDVADKGGKAGRVFSQWLRDEDRRALEEAEAEAAAKTTTLERSAPSKEEIGPESPAGMHAASGDKKKTRKAKKEKLVTAVSVSWSSNILFFALVLRPFLAANPSILP